jgi:hypothetical protein
MVEKLSGRSTSWMNIAENTPSRRCKNRLPDSATILVKRKLNSTEVIDAQTDLFTLRGVPAYSGHQNSCALANHSDRELVFIVALQNFFRFFEIRFDKPDILQKRG